MLMHHTLECARSRLNPESHWLVNGSLTESFCKNYLFSVTSLCCTFVNPFLVVHPMQQHILVHRVHRLNSAALSNRPGATVCKSSSVDISVLPAEIETARPARHAATEPEH